MPLTLTMATASSRWSATARIPADASPSISPVAPMRGSARPHQHRGRVTLRVAHDGPTGLRVDGDAPRPLPDVGPTAHLVRRQREAEHVVLLAGDERPVPSGVHGDRLGAACRRPPSGYRRRYPWRRA